MNRSVAGDVVVVQLLPESEWKGAADDVVDSESEFSFFVIYPLSQNSNHGLHLQP